MRDKGEIIIYKSKDGKETLDVRLENDTVWLTQAQMVQLFERDQSVLSRHINNVFKEGELDKKSNMYFLHIAKSDRPVAYYSLDVIISVGYRVKSLRGTQFRIWATNTLRDFLVKGYLVNEERLKQKTEKLHELRRTIELLQQVAENYQIETDEAKGLINVISTYSKSLELLDDYDHDRVEKPKQLKQAIYKFNDHNTRRAIKILREQTNATEIFGLEKDNSLDSVLNTIYQSFSEQEIYPSLEEKAANLLYLIIKDHPFIDGNKRIASFLFIWFLNVNEVMYKENGQRLIAENTIVAIALMIAESPAKNKELMVRLVVQLLSM